MAFANRYFTLERVPDANEIRHYQINCAPTVADDSATDVDSHSSPSLA